MATEEGPGFKVSSGTYSSTVSITMLLEPCTGAGRAASGEGTKAEEARDVTDSIFLRLRLNYGRGSPSSELGSNTKNSSSIRPSQHTPLGWVLAGPKRVGNESCRPFLTHVRVQTFSTHLDPPTTPPPAPDIPRLCPGAQTRNRFEVEAQRPRRWSLQCSERKKAKFC